MKEINNKDRVIHTLEQLYCKISDGHWGDIRILESDDSRYTIAIENAIELIKNMGE